MLPASSINISIWHASDSTIEAGVIKKNKPAELRKKKIISNKIMYISFIYGAVMHL